MLCPILLEVRNFSVKCCLSSVDMCIQFFLLCPYDGIRLPKYLNSYMSPLICLPNIHHSVMFGSLLLICLTLKSLFPPRWLSCYVSGEYVFHYLQYLLQLVFILFPQQCHLRTLTASVFWFIVLLFFNIFQHFLFLFLLQFKITYYSLYFFFSYNCFSFTYNY